MDAGPEIVVCIPSFRRPEGLRETLLSLAAQRTQHRFAIVVVDNDARDREALPVARALLGENLVGHAVLEERQGNVHAINTAFTTALARYPNARYCLMIDDDERATPDWLEAMVATAKAYDAQVVGGPVRRQFPASVSESIACHPLFLSIEAPTGPIPVIHGSGNCLIARTVFERLGAPFFDPAFNFSGGGDMDFFSRARAAGFAFAWAGDAIIHETVDGKRIAAGWLLRRSLRTGAINYMIDRKLRPGVSGWLTLAGKNLVSLLRGALRFIGALATTRRILPASHWVLMPLGRVLASFGWSTTPYKAS